MDADKTGAAMRPVKAAPVVLEYVRPGSELRLVTLTRLPSMEAHLLCAKLREQGVACVVADSNIATTDPLVFTTVVVQVPECDLERAKALLAEPAAVHEDDEYAEEAWRCPKCHRKTVEIVPMSPRWKKAVALFWVLVALPFLTWLVDDNIPAAAREWLGRVVVAWAMVTAGLALVLLLRVREKRCTTCGERWGRKSAIA